VLFFALNEACRLWELGVPAVVMDEAMRDWGWPMGPMRLIDEVGVDVTELIFGELKHYYSDRFAGTAICGRLRAAGLLGRKNGAGSGFYAYAGPTESPNPALGALPSAPPDPRFGPEEIRSRLHAAMVAEAKRALAEGVVKSADEADLALLLGAGFPAFRGGLLWQDRRAGPPAG
jgi:3-hydroxyacyl-CoA dehydrogenase/enoyl-CoA hydratase/3-hydroxybutyryl-CoA epimerase